MEITDCEQNHIKANHIIRNISGGGEWKQIHRRYLGLEKRRGFVRSDGTINGLYGRLNPGILMSGIVGGLMYIDDITARKTKQLRILEEAFRGNFGTAIGIALLNESGLPMAGEIKFMCEIVGYNEEELVASYFWISPIGRQILTLIYSGTY
jgi:hypothetical protein